MFIPLEGDNILFLDNVIAIYRDESGTVILKRNGKKENSSFSPETLKKRYYCFVKKEELQPEIELKD